MMIAWKVFVLFFLVISKPALAQLQIDFSLTLSKARNDGIQISINPAYPHRSQILLTLDPRVCYAAGTLAPLPNSDSLFFVTQLNPNGVFGITTESYFDSLAPMDVEVCYMLVGRGRVEASGWGRRLSTWPKNDFSQLNTGFRASQNRSDAVELSLDPPIVEPSNLYVSPAEDNNCPALGSEFHYQGRFYQVMEELFNGHYYLDTKAPLGIKLCYFLISKASQKCIATAIGYREP